MFCFGIKNNLIYSRTFGVLYDVLCSTTLPAKVQETSMKKHFFVRKNRFTIFAGILMYK